MDSSPISEMDKMCQKGLQSNNTAILLSPVTL